MSENLLEKYIVEKIETLEHSRDAWKHEVDKIKHMFTYKEIVNLTKKTLTFMLYINRHFFKKIKICFDDDGNMIDELKYSVAEILHILYIIDYRELRYRYLAYKQEKEGKGK